MIKVIGRLKLSEKLIRSTESFKHTDMLERLDKLRCLNQGKKKKSKRAHGEYVSYKWQGESSKRVINNSDSSRTSEFKIKLLCIWLKTVIR